MAGRRTRARAGVFELFVAQLSTGSSGAGPLEQKKAGKFGPGWIGWMG